MFSISITSSRYYVVKIIIVVVNSIFGLKDFSLDVNSVKILFNNQLMRARVLKSLSQFNVETKTLA